MKYVTMQLKKIQGQNISDWTGQEALEAERRLDAVEHYYLVSRYIQIV